MVIRPICNSGVSRIRGRSVATSPDCCLSYCMDHVCVLYCLVSTQQIHSPFTGILVLLLLLPLALQPILGFGLSNNVLLFFPICHQLCPSSYTQHLKISFYFLFPYFPGSSPSSRPFQFLSEDLFGYPILLHSL